MVLCYFFNSSSFLFFGGRRKTKLKNLFSLFPLSPSTSTLTEHQNRRPQTPQVLLRARRRIRNHHCPLHGPLMVRTGMRRDQRDRLRARLVRSAHSRGDPAQPDVHLPETRGHQRECLCIRVEQERDLVRGQSRTGRGAGGDGVSSSSRDGGGDQGLRGEKEKKKKREGRGG